MEHHLFVINPLLCPCLSWSPLEAICLHLVLFHHQTQRMVTKLPVYDKMATYPVGLRMEMKALHYKMVETAHNMMGMLPVGLNMVIMMVTAIVRHRVGMLSAAPRIVMQPG